MTKSIEARHRVAKFIFNVNGKISTFNTARDDDRSVEDIVKRQAWHQKQGGGYKMIKDYPDNFVIINVIENLPKDVAESYRSWEIRKDKAMGYEVLNSKENY